MSESNPGAWAVDLHPTNQWDFNFEKAVQDGWTDFFIKTSEGPYRDGSVLPLPGLPQFVKRAEAAGGRVGLYPYLVESFDKALANSGKANAEHYLRRVEQCGGIDRRLVMPDFEEYHKPYQYLTPSNGNLEAFMEYVQDRLDPGHPCVIYSGYYFWTGGNPSGPVENYGTKLTWDAELAAEEVVPQPRSYYHGMEHWGWNNRVWGGVKPIYWQFTWAGRVDGLNVDCDACRLSKEEHKALWQSAA